jgi:hypothetical protein
MVIQLIKPSDKEFIKALAKQHQKNKKEKIQETPELEP